MKIQQIYFSSQREENVICLQDETKNGQKITIIVKMMMLMLMLMMMI